VAAEDTRVARKLLDRFGIAAKLISYNEHNKSSRISALIAALSVGDVALVTDAGTPAISDPGVDLVAAARQAGHAVVPVPGASAVVTALSAAGLETRSFLFVGFLPREAGPLRRFYESLAADTSAVVAFEAPGRVRRALQALAAALPQRRIAVCRELTKLHEEIFVGTAAAALKHFIEPRGEFVLVIEGAVRTAKEAASEADESAWRAELALMKRLGLTRAQAAALLSDRYSVSRRRLYELWLEAPDEAGAV
jgi:16S rRNA (cytidine1402-2'-O)-methyltransferase